MNYWRVIFQATFRVSATIGKIRSFRGLPVGWHYGQGNPPALDTINAAVAIVTKAINAGFAENDAFVGADGEIQVTIYHEAVYLEFTIDPDLSIRFVREEGDNETERTYNLSLEEARSILENFEIEVWRSSGSSTATTIMREKDDFRTLPSRIPEMVLASQSSSMNALLQPANQFADT